MAIKHNNVVPNVHFRKWWQKYVKTWHNQAGRKKTRRTARQQKAAKLSPRPANFLRPAVHPPTQRYNFKLRAGRGFTLQELKAAGVAKCQAKTIGIAVDYRRVNRCQESLDTNVARLRDYMARLKLFPKGSKAKAGDTPRSELKGVVALAPCKTVLPIVQAPKRQKARAIAPAEKDKSAYKILHKARDDKKNYGKRIKRANEKAAKDKDK